MEIYSKGYSQKQVYKVKEVFFLKSSGFIYNLHCIMLKFYSSWFINWQFSLGNNMVKLAPMYQCMLLSQEKIKPWNCRDIQIHKYFYNMTTYRRPLCDFLLKANKPSASSLQSHSRSCQNQNISNHSSSTSVHVTLAIPALWDDSQEWYTAAIILDQLVHCVVLFCPLYVVFYVLQI